MSANTYIAKIQLGENTTQSIPIASTMFGICNTSPLTARKEVVLNSFDRLIDGVTIYIKFTLGCNELNNMTLKVNDCLAQTIIGNCTCAENDILAFTYEEIKSGTLVIGGQWHVHTNGISEAMESYITNLINSHVDSDSMIFKGFLNYENSLPNNGYHKGEIYYVQEDGNYSGILCNAGDLLLSVEDAIKNQARINLDHWIRIQNRAQLVSGPDPNETGPITNGGIAVFDGITGTVIKDSQYTIATSVPPNAIFTDTLYHEGQGLLLDIDTNEFSVDFNEVAEKNHEHGNITNNGYLKNYVGGVKGIVRTNIDGLIEAGPLFDDSAENNKFLNERGNWEYAVSSLDNHNGDLYVAKLNNHSSIYTGTNDQLSFYAPLTAGEQGQLLISVGEDAAPEWSSNVTLTSDSNDVVFNLNNHQISASYANTIFTHNLPSANGTFALLSENLETASMNKWLIGISNTGLIEAIDYELNRLYFSDTDINGHQSFIPTGHYASMTQIAVNADGLEDGYNFQVEGDSLFNGIIQVTNNTILNQNLLVSSTAYLGTTDIMDLDEEVLVVNGTSRFLDNIYTEGTITIDNSTDASENSGALNVYGGALIQRDLLVLQAVGIGTSNLIQNTILTINGDIDIVKTNQSQQTMVASLKTISNSVNNITTYELQFIPTTSETGSIGTSNNFWNAGYFSNLLQIGTGTTSSIAFTGNGTITLTAGTPLITLCSNNNNINSNWNISQTGGIFSITYDSDITSELMGQSNGFIINERLYINTTIPENSNEQFNLYVNGTTNLSDIVTIGNSINIINNGTPIASFELTENTNTYDYKIYSLVGGSIGTTLNPWTEGYFSNLLQIGDIILQKQVDEQNIINSILIDGTDNTLQLQTNNSSAILSFTSPTSTIEFITPSADWSINTITTYNNSTPIASQFSITDDLNTSLTGTQNGFEINPRLYINESIPISPTLNFFVNGDSQLDGNVTITGISNFGAAFLPLETNTFTLGRAEENNQTGLRWKGVYIGTDDTYGDKYTPIYWNNGVPETINIVQKIKWTIPAGYNQVTLAAANESFFTENSIVVQIVITQGEQYLTSPLTWESTTNNTIILTTTNNVEEAITGYILVIQGEVIADETDTSRITYTYAASNT